jgi:hypothetical protein
MSRLRRGSARERTSPSANSLRTAPDSAMRVNSSAFSEGTGAGSRPRMTRSVLLLPGRPHGPPCPEHRPTPPRSRAAPARLPGQPPRAVHRAWPAASHDRHPHRRLGKVSPRVQHHRRIRRRLERDRPVRVARRQISIPSRLQARHSSAAACHLRPLGHDLFCRGLSDPAHRHEDSAGRRNAMVSGSPNCSSRRRRAPGRGRQHRKGDPGSDVSEAMPARGGAGDDAIAAPRRQRTVLHGQRHEIGMAAKGASVRYSGRHL